MITTEQKIMHAYNEGKAAGLAERGIPAAKRASDYPRLDLQSAAMVATGFNECRDALLSASPADHVRGVTEIVPTAEARHIDTIAVDEFAIVMTAKMDEARTKGRSGWQECDPAQLSQMLREHVEKGDPRDVANFCMMLWHHGAPISAAEANPVAADAQAFVDAVDQALCAVSAVPLVYTHFGVQEYKTPARVKSDVISAVRSVRLTTAMLAAAPQQPAPLKDHQVAQIVNAVCDVAIKFHDHQSLRERIAEIIVPALQQPAPAVGADAVRNAALEEAAILFDEMHAVTGTQHNYFAFGAGRIRALQAGEQS